MKKLKNYILESKDYTIMNLTVSYDCEIGKNIILEAPASWQESDIQQYLEDEFMKSMPSSKLLAAKFFGKNADSIYDAFFSYTTFEHLAEYSKNYTDKEITFDKNYKGKNIDQNEEFNYFKIKGLQFVLQFSSFKVYGIDDDVHAEDNIREAVNVIFERTVSNEINKYPLTLSLNQKNINYDQIA